METEAVEEQFRALLDGNLIILIVSAAVCVALFVFAPRGVHAAVTRVFSVQLAGAAADPLRRGEISKRAQTIEHLVDAILRIAIVATFALIIIGVFGWWGILAGVGLVIAALTVAGQSIVLDYLMGILIVTEGQYFVGDWICVGPVEGQVEEVGLRRTVIRDASGTVHSVSNGEIRVVSNMTRVFATAEVVLPGVREEDVERVTTLMDQVGRELAADDAWSDRIIEAPAFVAVSDFTDLGLTLTMRGRVPAADRWSAASELRKRLSAALIEAGVELNQRGVTPRSDRAGTAASAGVDPPD